MDIDFLQWYKKIQQVDYVPREHKEASFNMFKKSKKILNKLDIKKEFKVLDIGCGYGYHCKWFAQRGCTVTGVTDFINPELKQLSKEYKFNLVCQDFHSFSFDLNYFDLIWSHHSLEHSFSPIYALCHWYQFLKVNGVLCITVPTYKELIVSGHFYNGWSIGQLLYLLTLTGYNTRDFNFGSYSNNVFGIVYKFEEDPSELIQGFSWLKNMKLYLPVKHINIKKTLRSIGQYAYWCNNGKI